MKKIKRTKLLDRIQNVRDARLFVIATEGAKTEKNYFELFGNSRLKVEVVAAGEDNKSAPEYVIERLDEFAKKYDLSADDSLWLVLDVDRWGDQKLSAVCREAQQKNYQLAISNPCFEVWLCLHFDYLHPDDVTCKDFKKRFKVLQSADEHKSQNFFVERVPEAIERSKTLHPSTQENWPTTIGSHVNRLMENILLSMG